VAGLGNFPIGWVHPIDKELLQSHYLEPVALNLGAWNGAEVPMFDRLKRFFQDVIGAEPLAREPVDEIRLAVASLMIHVIGIDGAIGDAERRCFERLLEKHFQLDEAAVDELSEAARLADLEAVDLYRFTSILKRKVDLTGRLAIVELLWEMVFADGKVHEFEDNVVWRIADLLDIGTRDRVLIRKKVEADHAAYDDSA
jgi:uncharacterized tellurite resistance protein B-like protein